MTLDIKKGVVGVKKGNTPVQMLFCLKEKNQKKINSHRCASFLSICSLSVPLKNDILT
jgi:cellulose synthase/poly-beta-1,6-N-acetylglucosamine synthase-like glycosyltransferase